MHAHAYRLGPITGCGGDLHHVPIGLSWGGSRQDSVDAPDAASIDQVGHAMFTRLWLLTPIAVTTPLADAK
jgi:hypothetical protein